MKEEGLYRIALNLSPYSELFAFQENVSTTMIIQTSHVTMSKNRFNSLVLDSKIKSKKILTKVGECKPQQVSYIKDAFIGAKGGASRAVAYVSNKRDYGSFYSSWFGGQFSADRYNTVLGVFQKLNNYFTSGQYNYDCNNTVVNPKFCPENYYAYAQFADPTFTLHFCPRYFQDQSVKFRAVIHELTHFDPLGARRDIQYGYQQCLQLASRNPDQAVLNADNYAFFADSKF